MRRIRTRTLATLVLLLVLAAAAVWFTRREVVAVVVGDGLAARHALAVTEGRAKRIEVGIENFSFTPKDLFVAAGSTITWVNRDDVPHTATSTAGPASFDSKALDTDDKYSFTFTMPGTYRYFCKVHPHMTGSVVVR